MSWGTQTSFLFFFSCSFKGSKGTCDDTWGEGFLQVRHTWCRGKTNEADNRFSLIGLCRLPELFNQISDFWGKEKALSLLSIDLGLGWVAGTFHLASKIPTARIWRAARAELKAFLMFVLGQASPQEPVIFGHQALIGQRKLQHITWSRQLPWGEENLWITQSDFFALEITTLPF